MKRYLVFGGSRYYPEGGWEDFKGSFDTVDECVKPTDEDGESFWIDWWHVVDSQTGSVVAKYDN